MNRILRPIIIGFVFMSLFAAGPWQSLALATDPIHETGNVIQGMKLTASNDVTGEQLDSYRVSAPFLVYLPLVRRGALPCSPLYSDNFDNPSSGWPVGDNGAVLTGYDSGEYRILVRPKDTPGHATPGVLAAEYSIAVDLRNVNNVWGSYGLAFEIDPSWNTYYSFEIFPTGYFGLYRWDSPTTVTTLGLAYYPVINQGSASNHIKIERYGSAIKAYVNKQLVANVTDGTYTGSKRFGLVAFTYTDNTSVNLDVRYNNLTVYPIKCSGMN